MADLHAGLPQPPGSHAAGGRRDPSGLPSEIGQRIVYAGTPISLLFGLAALTGAVEAWRSSTELASVPALGPLSDRELRRIARRHLAFRRRARVAARWLAFRGLAGLSSLEIGGIEHLDRALRGGSGAILVSAHLGYARLVKPLLAAHGRPALLVGPRPPATDDPPPAAGCGVARRGASARPDLAADLNLRPHLAALARNQTLIILIDSFTARHLLTASVLGVEVTFSSGPVSLARATGAPALPCFVIDGERGPRLVIHPPLEVQATNDARADHRVNVARFAAVYAQQARAQPHLWWARRSERRVGELALHDGFACYRSRRAGIRRREDSRP